MSQVRAVGPTRRRVAVGVVAMLVAVAGFLTYELALREPQVHVLSAGSAFDTTDRTQVAGFADHIVIGTVDRIVKVDTHNGGPWTIFAVTVVESLKGELVGEVELNQLGGSTRRDIWTVEGFTPMTVGGTYLIALTDDDGLLTSVGGSSAPMLISGEAARADSVSLWRDAIAHQRWPDGLPR